MERRLLLVNLMRSEVVGEGEDDVVLGFLDFEGGGELGGGHAVVGGVGVQGAVAFGVHVGGVDGKGTGTIA